MVVIAGTVRIRSEHRPEAIERAQSVSIASEREPGCRTYRISADLRDPDLFHVFEVWDDEAALAAHFQTQHLREFQNHLPRLMAGEMKIIQYEVSNAHQL